MLILLQISEFNKILLLYIYECQNSFQDIFELNVLKFYQNYQYFSIDFCTQQKFYPRTTSSLIMT